MIHRALLLLVAATVPLAAQGRGRGDMTLPEGWTTGSGLVYAEVEGVSLALDVFHPVAAPERPLPLVVFVHGGGWRAGSKRTGYARLPPIVATGRFVCATIDYRLAPTHLWPAQIHDCKAAVRWLRANAARFGLDPTRVGVWGTSAGGHLVAMLGLTAGVAELEGAVAPAESSAVQCVVDFCGPADLRDLGRRQGRADGFLGTGPDLAARAAQASPLLHARRDAPPFLIVHGEDDGTVPVEQSRQLHEALRAAGARSELIVLPGVGHGISGAEIEARVLAFFERELGPGRGVAEALDEALAR